MECQRTRCYQAHFGNKLGHACTRNCLLRYQCWGRHLLAAESEIDSDCCTRRHDRGYLKAGVRLNIRERSGKESATSGPPSAVTANGDALGEEG